MHTRAGKNLGFLFFKVFLKVFLLTNAGHKITTHEQRFGHVNATNRNSYLNIICIKLVTRVKKTKIRTCNLRFIGFKKPKIWIFRDF